MGAALGVKNLKGDDGIECPDLSARLAVHSAGTRVLVLTDVELLLGHVVSTPKLNNC